MKRIALAVFIGTMLMGGCKREEERIFPTATDLQGEWVERTNQDFKYRLHFVSDSLFITTPISIDTFLYVLDSGHWSINTTLLSDSVNILPRSGSSVIWINSQKDRLSTESIIPCYYCPSTTIQLFIKE